MHLDHCCSQPLLIRSLKMVQVGINIIPHVASFPSIRDVRRANNVQQPGQVLAVLGWHPNTLCATCGESGKNVGRVNFQFITPLDGNMTALVINGTQCEGGGGYFLAKCNTGCYQISRGTGWKGESFLPVSHHCCVLITEISSILD